MSLQGKFIYICLLSIFAILDILKLSNVISNKNARRARVLSVGN